MKKPKIFLSGGGTLGSVMPLIAVFEVLREKYDCVWVGSRKGIEKEFVKNENIRYVAIPGGKIRKYFSLKNIFAPVFILAGFFVSLFYLLAYRPKAVLVSGSFISVPLVWASWILGIRAIVHQEDIKIGLAGRLSIPFAFAVTTAFEETAEIIKHKNKFWIGNPVRKIFQNPKTEKWKGDLPLVLVLGGGLGSEDINKAIFKIAPEFSGKARILHLTGKNNTVGSLAPYSYTQVKGLWDEELAGVMAASDIVISRAGLSTISELAFLGKPAILIPLAGVGQAENAKYLLEKKSAVVVENMQKDLEREILALLQDKARQKELGQNIKKIFPPGAAESLARIIN